MVEMVEKFRTAIADELPAATTLRHRLHADPRVSGDESDTADDVVRALDAGPAAHVAGTGRVLRIGGDGPAVVLRAEDTEDRGILATKLHADGQWGDMLYVDGGPSTTGTVGKLRMKGREVFRHAVVNLAAVLGEVLEAAGKSPADVDWVVPHQANARIIDATARKLGLSPDKVVMTVDRHANTSAASVPLALDVAVKDGRIKRGDLVVLEAMGGGFTWGAALLSV